MFDNRSIENDGLTCHNFFNYKAKIYETTTARKSLTDVQMAERHVVTQKNMACSLAVCHK